MEVDDYCIIIILSGKKIWKKNIIFSWRCGRRRRWCAGRRRIGARWVVEWENLNVMPCLWCRWVILIQKAKLSTICASITIKALFRSAGSQFRTPCHCQRVDNHIFWGKNMEEKYLFSITEINFQKSKNRKFFGENENFEKLKISKI